jgi:integrase
MLHSCQKCAKICTMASKRSRTREWPVIRVIQRKRKTVWEVDTGFAVTPRIRKKFEEKDLADTFAEKLRLQRTNEGLKSFELTIGQRQDAEQALAILKGMSVSLKDVAEFYRRHSVVAETGKTVKGTWEELIDFKERIQKKRRGYVDGIKSRLKRFVEEFGSRPIAEVTATELQSWLYRDRKISDLTRKNYFALLSVLFSFAQGKRDRRRPTAAPYRLDNPMDAVAKPDFIIEPPQILTVAEAATLLRYAQTNQNTHGLLPYLTLAMFCGVRAAELAQLAWEDVNFKKAQVTIPARIAKKRRLRNIPIPENALSWLAEFKQATGPLSPPDCPHRLGRLVKGAGFKKWPKNALRHSFGSYHFALTDNAPETSARLGHKGDEVLFEHYRALADKDEAGLYFAITPSTTSARLQAPSDEPEHSA